MMGNWESESNFEELNREISGGLEGDPFHLNPNGF